MHAVSGEASRFKLSAIKLKSPVANPTKIVNAPINYTAHIDEAKKDQGIAHGRDMTIRGPELPCFRKSPDTYAVCGPWFVTKDEIPDPNNLDLSLRVNGELRQNSNTRRLVYNVERLIEYATSFYTLYPGDLIFTGTPEGVGPVKPGDLITAQIERIGRFDIRVADKYDQSP